MITIYLLKGCIHCDIVLKKLKEVSSRKICTVFIDKSEVMHLKIKDKRFKSFPIAFTGSPNSNGEPRKKSLSLTGSNRIINVINKIVKNNKFGDSSNLKGNNIDIKYELNNQGKIKTISQTKPKCFGGKCEIMNRVNEPCKFGINKENRISKQDKVNKQNRISKQNKVNKQNRINKQKEFSLEEIGINLPTSYSSFGNCKNEMLTFAAGSGYNKLPTEILNSKDSYIHSTKKVLTTPLGIEIDLGN